MRTAYGRLAALAFIASCGGVATATITGCAVPLASIIAIASNYLTYVNTFVQVAQGIWSVISPLLGNTVAPAANVQFNKAVNDVNAACAALSEAIAAAQIANNPNPNLQALINDCVTAVDEVAAAIAQYQTTPSASANVGANITTLQHMVTVIHRWEH